MLDELVGCIDELKNRISKHRNSLNENETRTRMQLIDPLLRVLGWDVSDPQFVIPEFKVSDGWADYALLRDDGKPAAMVEAKKLDEPLKPAHRAQMLKYAIELGIPYTGLTDGNHWELYNVFQPVPMEEKQILDVSLLDTHSHESALKLLLLWHPNLDAGNAVKANEPVLSETTSSGATSSETLQKSESTDSQHHTLIQSSDWVVFSDYNPPAGTPVPKAIRLWDNTEREINHWYEVLLVVAEKLFDDALLKYEDTPIQWTKSTYSIHTKSIHPSGKPFTNYRKIGKTGLFVNIHHSAKDIRGNTKKLLQKYGVNPREVYLRQPNSVQL